jgi:hypothetical protein
MATYVFPQAVPVPAWQAIPSPNMSMVHVPMSMSVPMSVPVPVPTMRIAAAHPSSSAPVAPTLKAVNTVPLTRKVLTQALSDLSERLYRSFQGQVRLVVHGGAVMVLHPHFSHRERDRSFVSEYRALGFHDAEQRLRTCIAETAFQFGLGADWMNDHADVALPWAKECVMSPDHSLTHLFI